MLVSMFNKYQANWHWSSNVDNWLRSQCIGKTLNFPCGKSRVGNLRADLDPMVKPDVIADLMNPFEKFSKFEFDTVICDPPFKYYAKRVWLHKISNLAKKRFILSTPNYAVYLGRKKWKKTYFITEDRGNFFIRLWQIFDRTYDVNILKQ